MISVFSISVAIPRGIWNIVVIGIVRMDMIATLDVDHDSPVFDGLSTPLHLFDFDLSRLFDRWLIKGS